MALQQRCSENTPVHPGKLGSYSFAVCLVNTRPQVARAQSRPPGGMVFRAFASPEFCSDIWFPESLGTLEEKPHMSLQHSTGSGFRISRKS